MFWSSRFIGAYTQATLHAPARSLRARLRGVLGWLARLR